jgi:hypothetical protein
LLFLLTGVLAVRHRHQRQNLVHLLVKSGDDIAGLESRLNLPLLTQTLTTGDLMHAELAEPLRLLQQQSSPRPPKPT